MLSSALNHTCACQIAPFSPILPSQFHSSASFPFCPPRLFMSQLSFFFSDPPFSFPTAVAPQDPFSRALKAPHNYHHSLRPRSTPGPTLGNESLVQDALTSYTFHTHYSGLSWNLSQSGLWCFHCNAFAFGNCSIQSHAAYSCPKSWSLPENRPRGRDPNRSRQGRSSRHHPIQGLRGYACAWPRGIGPWACEREDRRFDILRYIVGLESRAGMPGRKV